MRVSARAVADFVAKRHNLTFAHMQSPRRSWDIARPRQIAMYAIRELCPHMSMPAIGRLLGGRDHTTILHGVRKITQLIPIHERVSSEVDLTLEHFRAVQEAPEPLVDLMLAARIDATSKHLETLIHTARGRVADARLCA